LHLGVAPPELIACALMREIGYSVVTVLEIVIFLVQRIVGLVKLTQRAVALETHGRGDSVINQHRATPPFNNDMGAIVAPFDDSKMSAGIFVPDHRRMQLTVHRFAIKAAITPRMPAKQRLTRSPGAENPRSLTIHNFCG
jgi:hypothetical protein